MSQQFSIDDGFATFGVVQLFQGGDLCAGYRFPCSATVGGYYAYTGAGKMDYYYVGRAWSEDELVSVYFEGTSQSNRALIINRRTHEAPILTVSDIVLNDSTEITARIIGEYDQRTSCIENRLFHLGEKNCEH